MTTMWDFLLDFLILFLVKSGLSGLDFDHGPWMIMVVRIRRARWKCLDYFKVLAEIVKVNRKIKDMIRSTKTDSWTILMQGDTQWRSDSFLLWNSWIIMKNKEFIIPYMFFFVFEYVEIRSNTRSFIAQLRYLSRDILAQIWIHRPFNHSDWVWVELGRTQYYWLTISLNGALFLTLIFDQILWHMRYSTIKIKNYIQSVSFIKTVSPLCPTNKLQDHCK